MSATVKMTPPAAKYGLAQVTWENGETDETLHFLEEVHDISAEPPGRFVRVVCCPERGKILRFVRLDVCPKGLTWRY